MRRVVTVVLAFLILLTVQGFAKWNFVKNFPDDNLKVNTGAHGVVCDPEGKIWFQAYGATKKIVNDKGDSVLVREIFCWYPDGSPAPMNGTTMLTLPDGKVDTLWNSHRGLGLDQDGNILWTAFDAIYRLDYKTGAVLQKWLPKPNATLTAPACDAEGNIYVNFVLPGNPIMVFDKDLNYLGNAIEAEVGYGRNVWVSADGLELYSPRYDKLGTFKYTREDVFSSFTGPDTVLKGTCSQSNWAINPGTGKVWLDAGSYFDMPNRFPGVETHYTPNTYYEMDLATETVSDSLTWNFNTPASPDERPRGLGFSVTGDTAYIACFGASTYPALQMFARGADTDVAVTFQIDMSVQDCYDKFDPAADKVVIRGSFNGWAGEADECKPTAAPGIYSLTKIFPVTDIGTTIEYKFVMMPGDRWESVANRTLMIPGSSTVLDVVFYDNVTECQQTVTANVTFQADVTDMLAKGFNPGTDALYVLGGFNGWAYNEEWITAPDLINPTLFTLTHAITDVAGTEFGWKFRGFPEANFADGGWEGGDNHTFVFTGTDLVLDAFKPNVTPAGKKLAQDVTVVFSVNVAGAMDYYNKQLFPTVDNVILNGDFAPLGTGGWAGWTVSDIGSGLIPMFDDGSADHGDAVAGDGIWSVKVLFATGSTASHYYKYGIYSTGYTDTLNAGTSPMDNEAGFSMNHVVSISDVSPVFVNATDKFGSQWVKVERMPDAGMPGEFVLHANYPNPFNPTTTISYELPVKSHVRLTIFNSMGQSVATLVNGEQTPGVYHATWDGTSNGAIVPSGIYFYRIEGEGFAKTMKMTLMK